MDLGTLCCPQGITEADLLERVALSDEDWQTTSWPHSSVKDAVQNYAECWLDNLLDDEYNEEHLFAVKDEAGQITFFNVNMQKTINIGIEDFVAAAE